MKKVYQLQCLYILLFSLVIAASAKAQIFKLIDINKTKNSNPVNYQFSQHSTFAFLQGNFYFTADDGIHGRELFKSNGTSNGTLLVKDITPGSSGSSNVLDIIVSGKMLYFTVTDSTNRQSIWVSDGTSAGTNPLKNITTVAGNPYFLFLTNVNGALYFSYTYYDFSGSHNELWKTDITGTAAVMVTAVNGYIQGMVGLNGRLFFTYYDYTSSIGSELYTSDGTAAGTKLVKDINPNIFGSSNPIHLTPLNGLLYFAADDGSGNKLWVSDGTPGGTYPVNNKDNILLGLDGAFGTDPFGIVNNTLYFQGKYFDPATSTSTGYELCKYNTSGTGQNVTLVKDIATGDSSSLPRNFTNVRGTLFFTTNTNFKGSQLWKSDGTNMGTLLVKDIDPGQPNYFYGLNNIDGILYFSYHNNSIGSELWKSDGTNAGTVLIKDIYPGALGSNPDYLLRKIGITLFSANGPGGNELWSTDGTTAGTVMVKDINTITTSSSDPYGLTALGDKAVFSAYDGVSISNLYVSDGSIKGTKSLGSAANLRHLFNTQNDFTVFKKEAYFIDLDNRLWKTNGTQAGTGLLPLPALLNVDSGFIMNLVATPKLLYIITYDYPTNTSSVWRTDGTPTGTYILKSGINSSFNLFPTAVGNTLYFAGIDIYAGSQLWKTDGSVAGTVLVKNIGSQNYNPLANLYSFKGKLYFNAYPNAGGGPALWTSDGTYTGTVILKNLTLLQQPFAQANGKLFFYAFDNTVPLGNELYTTDGTDAGTHIVKDINPGFASSNVYLYPSSLISGDKILYFFADDGINGAEPWKSDGTSAGTILVKDAMPGYNFNYITAAVNSRDQLFFVENNNILWQSDGTAVNTNPISDASLNGLKQIFYLSAIGSNVFFSAYSYAVGQELYAGNSVVKSGSPQIINTTLFPAKSNTDLSAIQLKLSPDPARNILQVYVNGLKQNTPATISIFSSSGILISSKRSNSLDHVVQLDVASLAGGVYIVKVMSANKILYKQFIKL